MKLSNTGDLIASVLMHKTITKVCAYFWGTIGMLAWLSFLTLMCVGLIAKVGWFWGVVTILLTFLGIASGISAFVYLMEGD